VSEADRAASSPGSTRAIPHYPGIDVLRGLCVLAVVAHHVHLRFVLNHYDVAMLLPKPLSRVVFWSGYYAVIVFFVISGFLITTLSLRRWSTLPRVEWLAFYRLRFARIFPCLLALLAVLSALHLAGVPDYVIDPSRSSLPRAIVAALTFHFNWLEGTRGYLPGSWDVLWSLSVEEAFYVAFPLLCIALRREALMLVPILALIAVGPLSRVFDSGSEPWDEYAYLSCMDGIAFGCLAALIHARCTLAPRTLRLAFVAGVAAVSLIVVFRPTANALGLVKTGLYVSVLELGAALVLLAIAGGVFDRVRTRGPGVLGFVGRCSYEIYLTHMFVVFATVAAFRAADASLSLVGVWYVAAIAASVALGWLVARFYSTPANRWLRRPTPRTTVTAPAA
jgi:peptidoglycan/LPS O-acetylase OafA/YrhL